MSALVRPIRNDEYAAAAALVRAVLPGRSDTADAWRRADGEAVAARRPRRWVAVEEDGDRLAGYAAVWRVHLDKDRMDLAVRSEHRRRGIGSRLLAAVEQAARERGAATLQARVDGEDQASLDFLGHRGFAEVQQMVHLVQDLSAPLAFSLEMATERLRAAGIAVRTLAEEQVADPGCWSKLADLQNAVTPDWPDPDPGPPEMVSPDGFRQTLMAIEVIPEAFFLAAFGRAYAGYSGLARSGMEAGRAFSAGTAVHRAWRGNGVATALKLCCTAYARRHGYQSIGASSANPVMVRINERLGFRLVGVEVRLVRRMDLSPP